METKVGKWLIGLCCGLVAYITDNTPISFQVLLVVMIIDIVSGLIKGFKNKNLKSSIMAIGIAKKSAILLSILFTATLDKLFTPGHFPFATMMMFVAIGHESLSVIENLIACGVKIPKAIRDKIADMSDTEKEVESDE